MKNIYSISATLFCILFSVSVEANNSEKSWPTIKLAEKKMALTPDSSKVIVDIYSEAEPAKKLYELRCNKGGIADQDHIDFYGMFQCQLFPVDNIGLDLLCGDEPWAFNKCWNTRAVFNYEQLIGPCKNNSEFGNRRIFNMRGIKLELTISNFKSPSIPDILSEKKAPYYSFDFMAKAIPEKNAVSEFTSPAANEYCGGVYEINSNGKTEYKSQ